jgi:hypothetical protein
MHANQIVLDLLVHLHRFHYHLVFELVMVDYQSFAEQNFVDFLHMMFAAEQVVH